MKMRSYNFSYDFIGKRFLMVGLSLLAISASVILWFTKGPEWGVDFAGGTELLLSFQDDVTANEVRQTIESAGFDGAQVQSFEGSDRKYLVRLKEAETDTEGLSPLVNQTFFKTFGERYLPADAAGNPAKARGLGIIKNESIGPAVGAELKRQGVKAMVLALGCLLVYIWVRFQLRFGLGAVAALVHDTLITIGVFVLLGKEFNLPILAALLTIVGYSLNDTIVVFDRIRENLARYTARPLEEVLNISINETLSRTLMTSVTTLIVVACLFIFGGGIIHDFALALLVGVLVGTYSSIYVASPVILALEKRAKSATAAA